MLLHGYKIDSNVFLRPVFEGFFHGHKKAIFGVSFIEWFCYFSHSMPSDWVRDLKFWLWASYTWYIIGIICEDPTLTFPYFEIYRILNHCASLDSQSCIVYLSVCFIFYPTVQLIRQNSRRCFTWNIPSLYPFFPLFEHFRGKDEHSSYHLERLWTFLFTYRADFFKVPEKHRARENKLCSWRNKLRYVLPWT